jgi:hypothetical protein
MCALALAALASKSGFDRRDLTGFRRAAYNAGELFSSDVDHQTRRLRILAHELA